MQRETPGPRSSLGELAAEGQVSGTGFKADTGLDRRGDHYWIDRG